MTMARRSPALYVSAHSWAAPSPPGSLTLLGGSHAGAADADWSALAAKLRDAFGPVSIPLVLSARLCRFVTLPSRLVHRTRELSGLEEKLNLPKELRGTPTSLDGMSPNHPILLAMADIPLAPGVKGHSIIAVEGEGDFHLGRDGLVTYDSAHVDYVESEFIVRSFHSCQDKPPTIEEVRRILHEHLKSLPAPVTK